MLLLNVICMYGSNTYSLWTPQLLSMVRGEIGLDIFCFLYCLFICVSLLFCNGQWWSFVAYTKYRTYILTCFCYYYISSSKLFSPCPFYSYSNLMVFWTMVYAGVICFIVLYLVYATKLHHCPLQNNSETHINKQYRKHSQIPFILGPWWLNELGSWIT
jgi:hypothetical protein